MMGSGAIFWLILAVLLIVIESVSVQLYGIWFAVGAVFAVFASLFGLPFWAQSLVFLVFSVATLIYGRPILLKKLKSPDVPLHLDRIIGMVGVVQEEINNAEHRGRVYIDGLDWSARSHDGDIIAGGNKVKVNKIDSVKLIVERVEE